MQPLFNSETQTKVEMKVSIEFSSDIYQCHLVRVVVSEIFPSRFGERHECCEGPLFTHVTPFEVFIISDIDVVGVIGKLHFESIERVITHDNYTLSHIVYWGEPKSKPETIQPNQPHAASE